MRSLNYFKQSMRKNKESEIVFISPTFSRTHSAAVDSSNATNVLNRNRVSFLNIFEDIFPMKCNRKPTKWKFHLFNEFSSILLARVKFISFCSIFFRFSGEVAIFTLRIIFPFPCSRIFRFPFGLKLIQPEKKVFEIFAWIFFRIFVFLVL